MDMGIVNKTIAAGMYGGRDTHGPIRFLDRYKFHNRRSELP